MLTKSEAAAIELRIDALDTAIIALRKERNLIELTVLCSAPGCGHRWSTHGREVPTYHKYNGETKQYEACVPYSTFICVAGVGMGDICGCKLTLDN